MNLNDPRHPWSRLTAAARQVQDEREASAPYGFSTRIAALAFAQEQRVFSLFERFAFRAVGLACILALASVALNYSALTMPTATTTAMAEEVMPVDDAVAVVLDLGD
jgi:hypothetical protein